MSRLLLDVNALAVSLVQNHPGHEHVMDALGAGLRGQETLLVFDYLPLRAHWVLTSRWGIGETSATSAVRSFLDQPVEVVSGDRETLLTAYETSERLAHDVYDCYYLALASEHDADAIVTTDTDFERLCDGTDVGYRNPVPEGVLSRFHEMNE